MVALRRLCPGIDTAPHPHHRAPRRALIGVTNARIGHIVDVARFALDLEIMELDTAGIWPHADDPQYRPTPNLVYADDTGPAYGHLPKRLLVSHEIRKTLAQSVPGENLLRNGDGDDTALPGNDPE